MAQELDSTAIAPKDFLFGGQPELCSIANRVACFLPLPIRESRFLDQAGGALFWPLSSMALRFRA